MNTTVIRLLQVSFFFLLQMQGFAWGWADHHFITKEILKNNFPENSKVQYQPLSELLSALNIADEAEFKIKLQINKNYQFANKLGENNSAAVSILDILSTYSDEPDWGMDQELFSADQYPELWKDEYSMMGGKQGLSSQSFRHMYWRELYWKHPIQSFKLPLNKINEPMGEAPQRAEIFMKLAKLAFSKNQNYWGWRFTANSLHYIEDVAQPFHSSQVPSKILINMVLSQCLTKYGCDNFVARMTNIISYYHFAYEDSMSLLFKKQQEGTLNISPNPIQALNQNHSLNYLNLVPQRITVLMSELSNSYSARAGRASISFFPMFKGSYADLNANTFMDENWWKTNNYNLEQNSSARTAYLDNINSMFYELGDAVRSWIKNIELP
ncbi:MAG: hypothetical protein ACXVCP_03295 [Bdellovibrio sp.]